MRASIAAAVPASTSRSGLPTATTGAVVRAMPRLAAAAYPTLPSGVTTRTAGNARSTSASDPSAEPLSTTTTSGVPALVSANSDRTHASRSGPASKFTTTAAHCRSPSLTSGRSVPGAARGDMSLNPRSGT